MFVGVCMFICMPFSLFANYIQGQIIDDSTNQAIPFAVITINHEDEVITDIEGNFNIPNLNIRHLTFKSPGYYSVSIHTDTVFPRKLEVRMLGNYTKTYIKKSEPFIKEFINRVLAKSADYNAKKLKPFKYQSYNKLTVSADDWDQGYNDLELILNLLTKKQIKKIQGSHYLFLAETFSETHYLDDIDFKENIEANKISGIESSKALGLVRTMQYFSAYDPHITILQAQYISPLHPRTLERYNFEISDTISFSNKTLLIVKFNPKKGRRFDGLAGYLYIDAKTLAVNYLVASPTAMSLSLYKRTFQELISINGIMFPTATKTLLSAKRFNSTTQHFWVSLRSYNTLPHKMPDLKRNDFDEIAWDFSDSSNHKSNQYWQIVRLEPLTVKDTNTYLFFKNLGTIKNFDKLVNLGEKIVNGQIPLNKFSFDLKNTFAFNPYEYIRFGVGVHTSEKASKKLRLGGYCAYGTNDKAFKYGGNIGIKLSEKNDLWFTYSHKQDLREAGAQTIIFDRGYFSSEKLRKFGVQVKDSITKHEFSIAGKIAKYLKGAISFKTIACNPTYYYSYRHNPDNTIYHYTEIGVGFRYAYGEKYIKGLHSHLSLRSKFPILYIQYTKGVNSLTKGEYEYERLDLKITKTIKIGDLGKTTVEWINGFAQGNMPYSTLYNAPGDKSLGFLVRNAFETMQFNEFLSDRFSSLFLNYNYGLLFNKSKRFNPDLWITQNMGFGDLSHPEYHEGISFKTMEKGYYEAGLVVGNLLTINIAGLSMGFGAGMYYRYGPYSFDNFNDNAVYKISFDFY